MFCIVSATVPLEVLLLAFLISIPIVDVFLSLYKEYVSKLEKFSKNSFILTKTGSCTIEFSILIVLWSFNSEL